MNNVSIIGAKRTPIGSFQGSLSSFSAPELAAHAIKAAVLEATIPNNQIDEVIMGQVLQGGVGQAPARQAALLAGLSSQTPATTVNKVCGSGLKAVMLGEQSIRLGEARLVVAGGMESMSQAPYILPKAREGWRMGNQVALDLMIHDGLWDPYGKAHMGNFGDQCANTHHFSRDDQDQFAKKSYEKARLAQQNGWFQQEIAPISVKVKNEEREIALDEEPNRYAPEKFAMLKPAFSQAGSVTAANASKINDGAAAVVLAAETMVSSLKVPVLGRIIASACVANEPQWFTTAPARAIQAVAQKASVAVGDIELFEINEAFSVVPLYAMRELEIDEARVNVFGGAVALGHPIGCSGARLVVTLLNALRIKNKRFGCIAVCLGGGEAVSMLIERQA